MNELHELDKELDKFQRLYNECVMYSKKINAKTSDINGVCISKIIYEDDFGITVGWTLVNGIPVACNYVNV